nr:acyl-CoA dehydrogenase [Leucobacter sp.]
MANTAPRINVQQVSDALLGKWKAERLESRELVRNNPSLHTIPGQPMDEHRIRVLNQLHELVDAGAIQRAFPASLGGQDNHGGNVAAFQELVLADPSMQIKGGVQWGLF